MIYFSNNNIIHIKNNKLYLEISDNNNIELVLYNTLLDNAVYDINKDIIAVHKDNFGINIWVNARHEGKSMYTRFFVSMSNVKRAKG
jgi:hypothetical protein